MQRFKGIAALLMLVLTVPLPRACAAISCGAKVQQDCSEHHHAESCCEGSSKLCCAAQAPADTTPYPGQNVSSLMLPTATVAWVYPHRTDSFTSSYVVLHWPAQHSPPGLVIAATTVLRI